MKNTMFDDFLKDKINQQSGVLDKDKEWQLLAPKLKNKKSKRKVLFWWFFPLVGIIGALLFFNSHNINQTYNQSSITALDQTSTFEQITKQETKSITNQSKNHIIKSDNIKLTNNAIHKSNTSVAQIGMTEYPNTANHEMKSKHYKNEQDITIDFTPPKNADISYNYSNSQPVNSIQEPISTAIEIVDDVWNNDNLLLTQVETHNLTNLSIAKLQVIEATSVNSLFQNNLVLPAIQSDNSELKKSMTKNQQHELSMLFSYGKISQIISNHDQAKSARLLTEKALDQLSLDILSKQNLGNKFSYSCGLNFSQKTMVFKQNFKDTSVEKISGQVLREKIGSDLQVSYDTGTIEREVYRNVNRQYYNKIYSFYMPIVCQFSFHVKQNVIQPKFGVLLPIAEKQLTQSVSHTETDFLLHKSNTAFHFFKQPCSLLLGTQVVLNINENMKWPLGINYQTDLSFRKPEYSGSKFQSWTFSTGVIYTINKKADK